MATWNNAFLIYNPSAGKFNRESGRLLQRTIDALQVHGHHVTVVPTTGPGTAPRLVRDCIARGADLIIAAGGDGTINEVANGVIPSAVPLAILPGGTANVLSVELGIGTRMVHAAERLCDMVPERIAAGLLENDLGKRHFLLMAGAGFDALIVYNIDAVLKSRIGRAAYWIAGLKAFGRSLPQLEARIEGRRSQCSFALASRVKNYGGDLEIARGASLFSNQFEVVLFEGEDSRPYLKYLLGVISGRLNQMRGISIAPTDSVHLNGNAASGIYIQIDGEFAGRLPARLSIVPDALTLLVPPAFRDKYKRRRNG